MSPAVTAKELLDRLTRHYIAPGDDLPGGVLLPELCHPSVPRRMDALYIGFVNSRGTTLEGHEIKVTRSDWRAELDDHGKADCWWPYVHRWWIVAPSTDVVPVEELPDEWGLMVPGRARTRLEIVRRPPPHEPTVDFPLLLEIAKKLDTQRSGAVRRAREQERVKMRKEADERVAIVHDSHDDAERRALAALRTLEADLGVRFFEGPTPSIDLDALPWHTSANVAEEVRAALAGMRNRQVAERAVDAALRGAAAAVESLTQVRDALTLAPSDGADSSPENAARPA